jgi:hypothetical protein
MIWNILHGSAKPGLILFDDYVASAKNQKLVWDIFYTN